MKFVTKHSVAASIALLFIVAISFSLLRTKPTSHSVDSMKSSIEESGPEDMSEIIGGVLANTARYPYFCFIGHYSSTGYRPMCGGSLIHDDMVLTAAHCVLDFATGKTLTNLFAFCGINDSFNPQAPFDLAASKYSRSDEIFTANYNHPSQGANDFALMKLAGPLDGMKKVTLNRESSIPMTGGGVTAMGFGQTESTSVSPVLRKADLTIASTNVCAPQAAFPFVDSLMMCAQTYGKGTCSGDSGSPLIIPGSDSSSDLQVGLSSFKSHKGCAHQDATAPDYYARVSAWYDEIVRIVCKESARASTSPLCSSGSGSGTCHDVPGWLDRHGTPCWWYAQGNLCEVYGTMEMFRNHGKRAKEACCACGGGVRN